MNATQAITATRAAIGASCWFTPELAARLFGMDIASDVSGRFYLKLGGTRDFALAASSGTLSGDARKQALRIAAACDVADMVAAKLAYREGKHSKGATGLWLVASGTCFALSVAAMNET